MYLLKLLSFRLSHLLIVDLSVCATGVIFRERYPTPIRSPVMTSDTVSKMNCAAINLAAGGAQAVWDTDMLLRQGRFANQQNGYPPQVYDLLNAIATWAWKALPNRGEVSGNLTKIIQGPTEPFSDFVARLVEVAGKIFGDSDTAMPLIKQLAYEQCTGVQGSYHSIQKQGAGILDESMQRVRMSLTNAGLVAAVLRLSKNRGNTGTCFRCGKTGRIKRNCPQGGSTQQGNAQGNDLPTALQGPQIYGAMEDQNQERSQKQWPTFRHPKDQGGPLVLRPQMGVRTVDSALQGPLQPARHSGITNREVIYYPEDYESILG
ncbi:protease-like protein [Cricetulus griseus]|uniref:Protease-like protein n=1 Tax=Cricetulus griseus TaxID=10029 RepID=A0A061IQS1_CRIGR|nr:protease-like protein [Cricetulus griseus]